MVNSKRAAIIAIPASVRRYSAGVQHHPAEEQEDHRIGIRCRGRLHVGDPEEREHAKRYWL
jgi:hypothetical protein